MNPLTIFVSQYKIYFILALFAVWSVGVWHVASTYTEAGALKTQLETSNKLLENVESNRGLADKLTGELQKGLKDYFAKAKPITKEIQREIVTNNIYSDCKSTDGVVRNYKDKLNAQ